MLLPSPARILSEITGPRRADSLVVELWDAWAFAEIDAELALKRWWEAADWERAGAHAAYCAALERETQAAAALERQLKLTNGTAPASA
jgi:hypothetical protein